MINIWSKYFQRDETDPEPSYHHLNDHHYDNLGMIISQWDSHSLTHSLSWLSQSEILTHRWLQLRKLETAAAVSTLFQKSWSPRINSNCVPSSIPDMMRCKKMLMIKPSNCKFVSLSSQPPTWGHIHTWREFQKAIEKFFIASWKRVSLLSTTSSSSSWL